MYTFFWMVSRCTFPCMMLTNINKSLYVLPLLSFIIATIFYMQANEMYNEDVG